MITVLTGGTGGAKFVQGLAHIVPARALTVIVNTGDDMKWWWGLHISPDIDSIVYALAGKLSRERGWGLQGDTFECLARMKQLGQEAWFQLGDRDLATHILRTQLLSEANTLTEATQQIAGLYGVKARVLPMSDHRLETRVLTEEMGELSFQEYFVRERWRPKVKSVRFAFARRARASAEVLQAIGKADAVLIAPSNPVTSIGPILAVPGIRKALINTKARVLAVSPIVGGAAVSGPAAAMMKMRGWQVSPAGVARAYRDFLNVLLFDERDAAEKSDIEALGVKARSTRTIMRTDKDKKALAQFALRAALPAKAASA